GTAQVDSDGGVFVAAGAGGVGFRCVVHRIDGDGAGSRGAVFQAVVIHRGVLEVGGAVPVGIGHEGDAGAVAGGRYAVTDIQRYAIELQDAVGRQRLDHEVGDSAVAIRAAERNRDAGGIFVAAGAGGVGFRRVVHRIDGDIQRRAAAGIGDVGDLRHRTVPVGVRGEGVVTVGGNGQGADTGNGGGLA